MLTWKQIFVSYKYWFLSPGWGGGEKDYKPGEDKGVSRWGWRGLQIQGSRAVSHLRSQNWNARRLTQPKGTKWGWTLGNTERTPKWTGISLRQPLELVNKHITWHGIVWSGVAWHRVAWCSTVWNGMHGMMWYSLELCNVTQQSVVWCDLVWYSMA